MGTLTLSGRALGLDLWITKLILKWLRNSFKVMLPSSSFWKETQVGDQLDFLRISSTEVTLRGAFAINPDST